MQVSFPILYVFFFGRFRYRGEKSFLLSFLLGLVRIHTSLGGIPFQLEEPSSSCDDDSPVCDSNQMQQQIADVEDE